MDNVSVIGAGLAGCESAMQLAHMGIPVRLYEMKPIYRSPAHHMDTLAELVCSNSLKADRIESASGLLKEEMRLLGSVIMRAADKHRVPAGGALAVDRDGFSAEVTNIVTNEPLIEVVHERVDNIPNGYVIIATGPLTDGTLAEAIGQLTGEPLYFFDAAAPIVTVASIDMSKVFRASRYNKGEADYLNCPMNKDEYLTFHAALIAAETAELKGFENKMVFEGCMPIEVMAARGVDTIRFGPLKPVGIINPRTGEQPYAVVQLRQDDAAGVLYNLVGFQTHLKFGEQKRVFGMIPGLENAEFVRYGVMHRNTFLNAPLLLDEYYRLKANPHVRFAGQMSGVEGYMESAASGLAAGLSLACELKGLPMPQWSSETAIGSLSTYISTPNKHFQPMNMNYGIMQSIGRVKGGKVEKQRQIAQRSIEKITAVKELIGYGNGRE